MIAGSGDFTFASNLFGAPREGARAQFSGAHEWAQKLGPHHLDCDEGRETKPAAVSRPAIRLFSRPTGCAAAGMRKRKRAGAFQAAPTGHFGALREIGESIPEPTLSVDCVEVAACESPDARMHRERVASQRIWSGLKIELNRRSRRTGEHSPQALRTTHAIGVSGAAATAGLPPCPGYANSPRTRSATTFSSPGRSIHIEMRSAPSPPFETATGGSPAISFSVASEAFSPLAPSSHFTIT